MISEDFLRTLDFEKVSGQIEDFIREQCAQAGKTNLVVGLSGGVDSSVTAALCVKALGREHVSGYMLPYRESSSASLDDAIEVAKHLQLFWRVMDITAMADGYLKQHEPDASFLRIGNICARVRMCASTINTLNTTR